MVIVGSGPVANAVEARCRAAGLDVHRVEVQPHDAPDLVAIRDACAVAPAKVVVLTTDDPLTFVIAAFAKQTPGVTEVVARVVEPRNERALRALDVAVVDVRELVVDAVVAALAT